MQITTLTQLGNSSATIIPSSILAESKWRRGQKFAIDYIQEAEGVFIRPIKKAAAPSRSEKEFQSWLDKFLKEDADILNELAHR